MRNLDLVFDKVHSGYDNFEGRLSFYPGDYASCCECGRSAQPELSDKWLRPNTVSSLPLLRQIPSALNVKVVSTLYYTQMSDLFEGFCGHRKSVSHFH